MLKLSDNPPMLPDGVDSICSLQGDWWVAHTKARTEKALAWELLSYSIPYFLPMAESTAVWANRRRTVFRLLFPSYVFFCGDQATRYKVLTTNRVCQVIPVRFRQQFVDELESVQRALESELTLDLYPFAAVGKRCRITKGSLEGIEGIVVRNDNITRLVLQVSMLGQGASLEIGADFLEPVD